MMEQNPYPEERKGKQASKHKPETGGASKSGGNKGRFSQELRTPFSSRAIWE